MPQNDALRARGRRGQGGEGEGVGEDDWFDREGSSNSSAAKVLQTLHKGREKQGRRDSS